MKRIDSMKDLEPYGIVPLTGESDAHAYRILCDMTKQGKAIIERTMDVQLSLHAAWNADSEDDPHIGSVLLPQEFVPPLAIFCLLSDSDISEVWLLKVGSVIGFEAEDNEMKERLRRHYDGEIKRVLRPRTSDRNLHQFTGRKT